ncbi:hypothetical protein [Rhodococcus chondri]|uniref:Transporter n=1 Tax=Rhodococcus chondri TaxID=3065941 RepID=A0ABU7JUN5_9NOCA|nr:hypothetical protein [Rhodococcus sp. CC-R104]MEE2033723.1 hypothetical protein [Rhodococcus sp. CC-R104]
MPGLSPVRWTALCAVAELCGMTAAASAAKLAQRTTGDAPQGREATVALALVVAGGLIEGIALGALQARGLRRLLPRLNGRRWLLITAAIAGLGWAAASAPGVLGGDGDGAQPSLVLVLGGALGLGVVMGAVLGAGQALVLRPLVRRPGRWVLANVAGWPPAMAVIYLGATTPSSTWSIPAVVALAAVTGLVAGTVLGLVTGQFLPALAEGRVPSSASAQRSVP